MIFLRDVTMEYPVPKRYREMLRHPLRPRRRELALREIDLEISDGECLGILGPNGAGKTTLLKLIGGLLYPTSGTASIDGFDTTTHNRYARKKVGFVINEERSFYWRLSGEQNLEFFGRLDNLSSDRLRDRVETLLGLVGLARARDKRVADYSSGMKQRLAIARGLLADPDVLLLDEPTKSLDPVGASDLRRLIIEEIDPSRKRTLILATNNVQDVVNLCSRLTIIDKARIAGSLRLLQKDEEEITRFYHDRVEGSP